MFFFTSVAAADIDDDQLPEIVAAQSDLNCPIAFEHDGTFKWMGDPSKYTYLPMEGAINIADLDHDGTPEIIMGSHVWDNTGKLKWAGTLSLDMACAHFSCCADINLDGMMEIIDGNTAYRYDGSVLWTNPGMPAKGYTCVADVDLDFYPEVIVTVQTNTIYLLNNDGSIRWGPLTVPGTGTLLSSVLIDDFDNDKYPEIVVANNDRLCMYNRAGSLSWTKIVADDTGVITPTAFDFDQDGYPEIVYNDHHTFYIIRGTDGATLDSVPNDSMTGYECPVIADVDKDNSADIIVICTETPPFVNTGIKTFSDGSWNDARPLWNQFNYRITNILDSGQIPLVEPYSWLVHNTYRSQIPGVPIFPVPLTDYPGYIAILLFIFITATSIILKS